MMGDAADRGRQKRSVGFAADVISDIPLEQVQTQRPNKRGKAGPLQRREGKGRTIRKTRRRIASIDLAALHSEKLRDEPKSPSPKKEKPFIASERRPSTFQTIYKKSSTFSSIVKLKLSKLLPSLNEPKKVILYEDQLGTDGLAQLHITAKNNTTKQIRLLLQSGADVNVKSSVDGATPLHMATRYNSFDAAAMLLHHGANPTDTLTTNGQTPLHVCCRRGNLNIIELLIDKGHADVNALDKDKTTPLHFAAFQGCIVICTLLVKHGANIRAKDNNMVTPLMMAAKCGNREVVHYIISMAIQKRISNTAHLSDTDIEGNTALHLAVGNRHIAVAKSLIERGAPVNCKKHNTGCTPLHQAAIIGEEALAEMLIDNGAQTEATDNDEMTPLHRAALYNRVDTILLLIRQGLYLNSQDNDNFTPLICSAWKGQTDAGRALLRYGADIKALDVAKKSCLHWAVEMQHMDYVQMLFESGHGGEDIIDWKDSRDHTALFNAAKVGNVKLLNLLIKHGACVILKDFEEKTPLHYASDPYLRMVKIANLRYWNKRNSKTKHAVAKNFGTYIENGCLYKSMRYGNVECIEALMQACPATLNDDDIDDMTPLLWASLNGHHHVVKLLLRIGADISSRNIDSQSALALAAKNNEVQVLDILISNNANVNSIDKDQNTPLHLCAQAGHEGPTIALLENGASLSMKNIYGAYPLDVAIENKHEGVAKAMLSDNSWEEAMDNLDADGHTPMRRLIAHLPEAALHVMNQCVTMSHDDLKHPELKVTHDYRYIDPGPEDVSFTRNNERYFALETMVEFRREKLLAHRLTQSSMSLKWKRFARYFNYADLIVYLIFIIQVSLYMHVSLERSNTAFIDKHGCPYPRPVNKSHDGSPITVTDSEPKHDDHHTLEENAEGSFEFVSQVFILCFVLVRLIYETGSIFRKKLDYMKAPENYLHLAMLIPNFMFAWPPNASPCYDQWVWGTVAVSMTWVNFIFVLNRFDFFGLYVTMFFTTLKSLLKAMSVYIFFIIGFALAFYICFQRINGTFVNEWHAFLTTFVMTLGEINKGDLLDTGESLHPFETPANILMVVFLFLMPMVLINLTIGISVGDIDEIMQSSYFKRFSNQVKVILRTENAFPLWLQRKAWIPKADFYPNDKKGTLLQKVRLVLDGKANKLFLKLSDEESLQDVTVQDVMVQVKRHEAMLADLTLVAQKQSDILRLIAEKHDIDVDNAGDPNEALKPVN